MLRMVSYSHRQKSGHFMCKFNRTFDVLTTPVRNGLDRFLEMCQYPCLATARHKGQHLGRPRVFVSRSRIESLRQEGQSWREMAQELNTNTATARSSRV